MQNEHLTNILMTWLYTDFLIVSVFRFYYLLRDFNANKTREKKRGRLSRFFSYVLHTLKKKLVMECQHIKFYFIWKYSLIASISYVRKSRIIFIITDMIILILIIKEKRCWPGYIICFIHRRSVIDDSWQLIWKGYIKLVPGSTRGNQLVEKSSIFLVWLV